MRGRAGVVCAIVCGVAVLAAPGVARADIGFQGPGYTSGTSGSPSGTKPENKLWWNDGFWWASMYHPASTDYRIFRLNLRAQTWVNTGVTLDDRPSTRADALSVGNKLFVASHKFDEVTNHNANPQAVDAMRLYRFSYNTTTNRYSQDGPPTIIDSQRSEALVIDRDSNGAIWATWVQQESPGGPHQVYVRKTGNNCTTGGLGNCSFGPVLVLDPSVSSDDLSSVVRFGGTKIGVMWSDTSDTTVPAIGALRFAVHNDGDPAGVWSQDPPVVSAAKAIDDHINLKADSLGRVYAVTKTKFISAANPGTRLHRRTAAGVWSTFTVSNAGLRRTRPIVLLDQQHNRIRVFEGPTGSTIYMKSSALGAISFPSGSPGTPVMRDVGSRLVNPSSTKQNITNGTRQIVMATNDLTRRYWHAYQQIVPCVNGTAANNVLYGTNGNDRLCGLGGRDTIRGLAGNDVLYGGSANDTLVGGPGKDTHFGGLGNDTIFSRDTLRELVNGGLGFDRARVNASDIRRSIERLF